MLVLFGGAPTWPPKKMSLSLVIEAKSYYSRVPTPWNEYLF